MFGSFRGYMCLIRSIEAHKKNIPKREQSRDKKENNGSSTGSAHERGVGETDYL